MHRLYLDLPQFTAGGPLFDSGVFMAGGLFNNRRAVVEVKMKNGKEEYLWRSKA